jgi:hypothetical protein
MVAKAIRNEWQPDHGILIVYGDSGPASEGIAIPIAALPTLAAHARRFISGAAAKTLPQGNSGPWHLAQHCAAQTFDVGILPTSTGEKVSLILDRGLETQIGFAIEPELARELGQQLLDSGSQATNIPQAKN